MKQAYSEEYYYLAQNRMGDMLDYAVNTLGYVLRDFYNYFLDSTISKQIEIGNPAYVAGKNGCELAKLVLEETFGEEIIEEDVMYLDKSVEYWIGWTLAYYQWYSSKSFCEIETVISVEELGKKYYPLHEADISKTVEIIDERFVERERQV